MTIDSPWFHLSLFDKGNAPWLWWPWMGPTLIRFRSPYHVLCRMLL
jgi:hypothetical protein